MKERRRLIPDPVDKKYPVTRARVKFFRARIDFYPDLERRYLILSTMGKKGLRNYDIPFSWHH